MKKLFFILSLFITSTLFAQVNTGKKVVTKVPGGGSADLSNYPTKDELNDSLGAKIDTSYKFSISAQKPLHFQVINKDSANLKMYLDSTVNPSDSSVPTSNAVKTYVDAHSAVIDTTTAVTGLTTLYQNSLKQNAITNLSDTSKYAKKSDSSIFATQTNLIQKGTNWINILKFGASPSKTSAQNTTAINAAATAAALVNGTVYVPAGTYLVDSISYDAQVSFIGDGLGSVLKSNSAVSMFTNSSDLSRSGTFANMVLDGNNIGTTCFNWTHVFNFKVSNVRIQNFTLGVNLTGSLMGDFYNCNFVNNTTGVTAVAYSGMQPNLVSFHNCIFNSSSQWAVNWVNGAGIAFVDCDFELNGTSANASTGAIQVAGMSSSTVSLSLEGCWFEQNNGTYLNILAPAGTANYFIDKTIFIANGSGSLYGINMANGTGAGAKNNLILENTNIPSFTTNSLAVDGAYCITTFINSNATGNSFTNGATSFIPTMKIASSAYRNYAIGDYVLTAPNTNLAFLVDNAAYKMSFAVANNTPSLSIFSNNIQIGGSTYLGNNGTLRLGGATAPTATLQIKAGTATAGTAPLKFTSGTNLTTPENGAVEFDGTDYYLTSNSVRYILTRTLIGTAAPTTTPLSVGVHFIDTTNKKEYVSTGTSSSSDWTILN